VRTKPTVENDDAEQGDAEHVSVLGVDSASQTSQPPLTGRGAAPNSTTGIENTKSAVAISNKLGLDGHTRTFSESVASRLGGSNKCQNTISPNELVEEALENDLKTGVRDGATQRHPRTSRPYAKAVHKWAFHRLYEYVTGQSRVGRVEYVRRINPAYTSQRCSKSVDSPTSSGTKSSAQ